MAQRRSQQLPLLVVILIILGSWLVRRLLHPSPPPYTCGTHCGEERWRIKTLFDRGAAKIDFTPRHTTVVELTAMRAPSSLAEEERSSAEGHVYSVEAVLLGWKQETASHGDHDFHLVLADSSDLTRTMIAEVPSEECEGACSSLQRDKFIEA